MPLKNWCLIHVGCSKSSLKHSIHFCGIFPSLKQNFIEYRSSKVSSRPDCIFETHQLWQSGFTRVYSNCCCSWSFETEIVKIGQSFHKMYSNNILNFQEFTTIFNAWTKKSGNLLNALCNSLFFITRSVEIGYKCVCVCVRVWERKRDRERERDERFGLRLMDCYIFLTLVVILYSGPSVFASLTGVGIRRDLLGAVYSRLLCTCRPLSESFVWPNPFWMLDRLFFLWLSVYI